MAFCFAFSNLTLKFTLFVDVSFHSSGALPQLNFPLMKVTTHQTSFCLCHSISRNRARKSTIRQNSDDIEHTFSHVSEYYLKTGCERQGYLPSHGSQPSVAFAWCSEETHRDTLHSWQQTHFHRSQYTTHTTHARGQTHTQMHSATEYVLIWTVRPQCSVNHV